MKAIIFDFNGTMFMDTDKHRLAWDGFFKREIGHGLTDEEFLTYACGPGNAEIMRRFCKRPLSDADIEALTEEKERIYRRMCREDEKNFHLVRGLPELLDRLKAAGTPMAIATGAGKSNMDFYFESFHLEKWFSRDHVVYEDGTLPGKPDPECYLRACARLGVAPGECVVVEDSFAGIESARRAGAGRIVAIATSNPREALAKLPGVDVVVDDFCDFNAICGERTPCA